MVNDIVDQASAFRPSATCACASQNSANDSLSHRSSHHSWVAESPNHMCAISCSTVPVRDSISVGDPCDDWKSSPSAISTQPASSLARCGNSGTKTWPYLAYG